LIDRGFVSAKGIVFCVCLIYRGFVSAKGKAFYVPFFSEKERNQRKLPKGGLGAGYATERQAFGIASQAPFPLWIPPNTPFGVPFAYRT